MQNVYIETMIKVETKVADALQLKNSKNLDEILNKG